MLVHLSISKRQSCLNTTDWRLIDPFNTKMTISKRRASTVFSRSNFTILDVINLSDPSPVNYTADNFFSFYEVLFKFFSSADITSTQFTFLLSISNYLLTNQGEQIDDGVGIRQLRLQEFLACPLVIFNNAYIEELMPDMGNSLSLAVPAYRVYPFTPYSC